MRLSTILTCALAMALACSPAHAAAPRAARAEPGQQPPARLAARALGDFRELVRNLSRWKTHWPYTYYDTPFLNENGLCEVHAVRLRTPSRHEWDAVMVETLYFATAKADDADRAACRGPVGRRNLLHADNADTASDALEILRRAKAAAGAEGPMPFPVSNVCEAPGPCFPAIEPRKALASLRIEDMELATSASWPTVGGAMDIEFAEPDEGAYPRIRIYLGDDRKILKVEFDWISGVSV